MNWLRTRLKEAGGQFPSDVVDLDVEELQAPNGQLTERAVGTGKAATDIIV